VTPEIVLGPPGTGKTTRLLQMVGVELEAGTSPSEIGYVSFTRKAAQEAVSRACEKFGKDRREFRHFRTIHSACYNSLGMVPGDVFQGNRLLEFGAWIGYRVSRHVYLESDYQQHPADRALFMENLARVRQIPLRQQYEMDHDDLQWNFVEYMASGLTKYKITNGLIDYTDMLQNYIDWVPPPRIKKLFVDEGQDLSSLQWSVVRKMATHCDRMVVAGDDDQAIYDWAGADVDHFVNMSGEVSTLNQSWRCPRSIQRLSAEIIGRVDNRRDKSWSPRDNDGLVERVSSMDQVDTSGEDVLILARNARYAEQFMRLLREAGVVYEWRGSTSVSKNLLQAVQDWEQLRQGKQMTVERVRAVYDFMQVGSGVRRGFKSLPDMSDTDEVTLSDLREHGGLMRFDIWHEALERMPNEERVYMLRARQQGERLTARPRVRVSTIHSAKGGESEHVVLLTDMAWKTSEEFFRRPESEHRVWYVGVTRARDRLTIVEPHSSRYYDV